LHAIGAIGTLDEYVGQAVVIEMNAVDAMITDKWRVSSLRFSSLVLKNGTHMYNMFKAVIAVMHKVHTHTYTHTSDVIIVIANGCRGSTVRFNSLVLRHVLN